MYKTRNTETGNGMRRMQGIGGNLYSGERSQRFRGILPNIPGNVLKHFRECRQTFWRMSKNIPGNVVKHSGECSQTCPGILPNIPGNVAKHSGEFCQTFPGIPSNIHCYLQVTLAKVRLSKSTVGSLSMGCSFIN